MKTIRLLIQGKVQGVYYRASAKEKANELGLTGWTKNLADGRVEIVATGTEDVLSHYIEWCKTGPSRAFVEDIDISELPLEIFTDFQISR